MSPQDETAPDCGARVARALRWIAEVLDDLEVRWVVAGGLALVLAACAGGTESPVTTVRDSAGARIVENRPPASADTCAIPDTAAVAIGVREGPEPYRLHRVMHGALLSDGGVAVVNQGSDEVRIFGPDGEFRHGFGRRGEGPGEFRSVFLLWRLPGDTLVVADYDPWRFSWFTPSGEFVRSAAARPLYPNSPEETGFLDDGTAVVGRACCWNPAPGFHDRELHVVRHARSGEAIDTLGVYPTGRTGWLSREDRLRGTPLFEPEASLAAAGDRVAVAPKGEREVRLLDPDGGLRTIVRWTGPDRRVTDADVEAYRERVLARYEGRPELRRNYADPYVSPDRPVHDRFPAHAGVRLSGAGEIWVRRYPRPRDPEGGGMRWLVFDRSGRFACHAGTPPAIENPWDLFEIGPDRILAKGETELGIERVLLFRRGGPAGP